MASARITTTWADGTVLDLEVDDDSPAYPDLLAQLVGEVLRMYRATCAASDEEQA